MLDGKGQEVPLERQWIGGLWRAVGWGKEVQPSKNRGTGRRIRRRPREQEAGAAALRALALGWAWHDQGLTPFVCGWRIKQLCQEKQA